MAAGVNATDMVNVHSLALQVPIRELMTLGMAAEQVEHHRRLDDRQPPKGEDLRGRKRNHLQFGALRAGVPTRGPPL